MSLRNLEIIFLLMCSNVTTTGRERRANLPRPRDETLAKCVSVAAFDLLLLLLLLLHHPPLALGRIGDVDRAAIAPPPGRQCGWLL